MACVGALRTFGAPAPLTLGVRPRMMKFPNPQKARLQALLGALLAWFYVLWFAGIPLFISKSYFFYGLGTSALLLIATLAVSLTLKCPNCGKSIAIVHRPPRLGPDWQAARKQFFPVEALKRLPRVERCSHCGTDLSFE